MQKDGQTRLAGRTAPQDASSPGSVTMLLSARLRTSRAEHRLEQRRLTDGDGEALRQ